ncbi:uncharacterized protein EURHEDRAFT_403185 [Aspergillus ruber CBS 135680]|uniref:RGS domain-containing protein n=1 Tax=Aspergillus ruber (strain CBS 135680) TaxID=1388766 RepID=A0A017SEI3_ASPRC|nr:uncharacterized protein EURHEDRAFT_403185 [Aspergillus ruber CBS 135680]EYE94640.1 hypothetical protein EURHEDRAFT_403185 [Aspergillus ruber CBS 135680]
MGSELGVTADSKAEPLITSVTTWWSCWACIWTVIIVSGIAFLIVNRKAPVLRVRGLGLSLAAIVTLHLYWITIQIGLMLGPLMPGDAEFWVMGIYLPLGIALFHASNSRFLHVAKAQKKYTQRDSTLESPSDSKKGSLINRFRHLDYSKKMIVVVGIGMLVQVFLTTLMWIISRKWHSSWGAPGTAVHGTPMEQKAEMGRGWEWWPTVVWQFFWAWIVAPIILWKSRNIHDTHGWRVQTIACAIGNLHATPMWLIAIYVPAMEKVNQYWLPPQWICLSIYVVEIFTIFLPCYEVIRDRSLRKETLDTIAQWEFKNKVSGSEAKSINSASIMAESLISRSNSVKTTDSSESILTMGALEYVLERHPTPLLEFSALHDFSGENIAFLTSVTEWKSSLPKAVYSTTPRGDNVKELIRERFNRALRIYAEFVSVRHADFPINISSQELKTLENIFETPTRIMYGEKREVDVTTPFVESPLSATFPPEGDGEGSDSEKTVQSTSSGPIEDRVQYWGDVPEGFDETVFNDAEKSIKYLVLTNTWPKFVKNQRDSIQSADTLC